MRLLDSFIEWLQNVFGFVKDMYDKDGDTFFIGAIFVILILLILVIVLARRAENSEDKPKKKIKYDDIDWSFHDGDQTKDAPNTEKEPAAKHAAREPEAVVPEYGIKAEDERNAFSGRDGLSPEIAEALLRTALRSSGNFDVPDWMSKRTLSLDEMDAIDAQEWVEQQLSEKKAEEHDKEVERATVEKIAAILEKLELEEDDLIKDQKEVKAEEDKPKEEEPIVKEPEKDQDETDKGLAPDPALNKVSFDTGTLAKILKEAEELKEEEKAKEDEEIENLLNELKARNEAEEPEEKEPGWNIAETLARLDAMQAENESLARELELDDSLKEFDLKDDLEEIGVDSKPVISDNTPEHDDRSFDRFDPDLLVNSEYKIRRYGADNRDTNRQGRKFTEEELMKQIRD